MNILSREHLKQVAYYCPHTGIFTRKEKTRGRFGQIGRQMGTTNKRGYVAICIDCQTYYAHRLAWFYTFGTWPFPDTDHRDRNKSNNCIKNLRCATRSENMLNVDYDAIYGDSK